MANIDLNILPNEAINQKNDTTKHVAWARGDSTTRTFKIIDDAGAAVNVSGYTQIKMTVNSLFDPADNSTQQFEIIGDIASGGANGLVTFTPTTTQTNILADTYFYDIQAEDGSNVISTLIKSKVHIIQDISKTVSGVSTPDAGVITLLIGDSIDNGATNSIKVGDGGDLKIYHQGDQSYISETNNTGQLYIQGAHIWFQTPSGSDYLKLQNQGAVEAYWRGTSPGKRFETTQTGIDVTGTVSADGLTLGDNEKIKLGTGSDFQIYQEGNNSYIKENDASGGLMIHAENIAIKNTLGTKNFIHTESNTDVRLSYDGSTRLKTTTGGIDVTGEVKGDTLDIDGNASIAGAITDVTTLTASGELEGGSLDINGNADISGNLVLGGDLNVTGTTTTVNQTNLDVSDNIIGLNRGASTNSNDSGFIIERGSTGHNAIFAWDESEDKFTLGLTTATPTSTGNLTIATGTLVANVEGNLTGTASQVQVNNSSGGTQFLAMFSADATAPQQIQVEGDLSYDRDNNVLDVNGTVTADGFTVGSGNNELKITVSNNNTFFTQTTSTANVFLDANNFVVRDQADQSYRINCGDSDGVVLYGSGSANRVETGAHTEGVLFKTGASGGLSTRAEITNSGLTVNGTVTADGITNAGAIANTGTLTNTGDVTIKSSSTDNIETPKLILERTIDDLAGVDFHDLGSIFGIGRGVQADGTLVSHTYAEIDFDAAVEVEGGEGGRITFKTTVGGATPTERASVRNDALYVQDKMVFQELGSDNAFTSLKATFDTDNNGIVLNLPSSAGTLALTSDIGYVAQPISNYVTDTAIDATEFAGYVGKKIIYTGAASTISLPNATAADIGKTWSILNAGTGVITIDVDASGTAQQVRHLHAGGVNTSTTDRTIAIGGVVEIICIAEDNGGITNSSTKPNYAIYGGGVI